MFTNRYTIESSENFVSYNFVSEGKNSTILKGVRFSKTEFENLLNLGFGDINKATKEIDDLVVSDNGDSEKVLSTGANTCLIFTEKYVNVKIIAVGSTKSRTRLYQIGINRNYETISELFYTWGLFDNQWEIFEKHKNYDVFIVQRKIK
jgi:hypothetical protein